MTDIPRSPARFFGEYVPAELAGLGSDFPERSSPGAVVFEVGGDAWSLRLQAGKVVVESGVAPDTLLRLTLAPEDFEPVVVAGAERLSKAGGPERQIVAARALSIDVERARMLRDSGGTVLLQLTSGAATHRLLVSIGGSNPKPDAPDCEIECAVDDLFAIQSGAANPLQLLLDGKIRIKGKAELALALGAALG
jgi:SCP-2 sterol transfer family protein